MRANRLFGSDRIQLIAALAYATAGCALFVWVIPWPETTPSLRPHPIGDFDMRGYRSPTRAR
jgi:hypothetical protein